MESTPMQIALREMHRLVTSPRFWMGLAAVALILSMMGPFETGRLLNFPERLVYWALHSVLTFFCGIFISITTGIYLTDRGMAEWAARVITGIIIGIPVAVIVWFINAIVFGMNMGGLDVFIRLIGYCVVISSAIALLYYLVAGSIGNDAEAGESAFPDGSPFLRRLPRSLGPNLLRISSQDHYVEAVTDRGSHLVLMRFSDAVAELEKADGIRIHRAHWVARAAIRDAIRKDGRLYILTSDDQELPVSRSYLKQARAYLEREPA